MEFKHSFGQNVTVEECPTCKGQVYAVELVEDKVPPYSTEILSVFVPKMQVVLHPCEHRIASAVIRQGLDGRQTAFLRKEATVPSDLEDTW